MAQELEMKILTDAAEFARCFEALSAHKGEPDGYVQVNYYFDTPDLALASAHAMLRVRRKKNCLYLQYKNKRKRVGEMLLCDEWEAELKEMPRTVNPSRFFDEAPDAECSLLGDLVTHRRDFIFPGAVVSLDENIYLGKTDFEIEIEGEEDAIETVAAFLSAQGESRQGNGKFSRFMQEYKHYYGDQSPKGESV